MSRILRHVGNKDFKGTRQRQIGEQKERAAQKLKEWKEAEAERKNWNTGMIVDYFDDAIRPMNPEERKASLLRGLKNNGRK